MSASAFRRGPGDGLPAGWPFNQLVARGRVVHGFVLFHVVLLVGYVSTLRVSGAAAGV